MSTRPRAPANTPFTVNTRVVGLGYSFADIREHSIPLDLRLWVLATPVDGTLIDLSLVSQVRETRNPRRRIVGLGFLPRRLRAPTMNKFMASQQRHDILQDVIIWSRKRYRSHPRLCRADGEITPYRDYCAQFYPNPRDCAVSPPEAVAPEEDYSSAGNSTTRT